MKLSLMAAVCAGAVGCGRHKVVTFVVPPSALAPAELEVVDVPENLPLLDEEPMQEMTAPEVTELGPRVTRRPAARPQAKDTTPIVAADPSAVLAIGALSSGVDSTPAAQQQVRDLIASIQRRVAGLPARIANQQKNMVRQINTFVRQAQQALDSGDAEGGRNLATKAKLLMDDVEKK